MHLQCLCASSPTFSPVCQSTATPSPARPHRQGKPYFLLYIQIFVFFLYVVSTERQSIALLWTSPPTSPHAHPFAPSFAGLSMVPPGRRSWLCIFYVVIISMRVAPGACNSVLGAHGELFVWPLVCRLSQDLFAPTGPARALQDTAPAFSPTLLTVSLNQTTQNVLLATFTPPTYTGPCFLTYSLITSFPTVSVLCFIINACFITKFRLSPSGSSCFRTTTPCG